MLFENLYLKEKVIEIQGNTLTLQKFNSSDRAIIAPIVGAIITMAKEASDKSKNNKINKNPEPFDLSSYDMQKAIDENKKWTESVVFMLTRGVKEITPKHAVEIVDRMEPKFLDTIILEIIRFNYLELDESNAKVSKKKS